MSILVNGYEMRTLQQPMYLGDGRQVLEVWVGGDKVYPEWYAGILFFIDTSGSMTSSKAIAGIEKVLSSTNAGFFAAKAYGGHSGVIEEWTPDIRSIEAAVQRHDFYGSGDDDYPFSAMKSLAEDAWIGRPSHIAVIGDYEFNLSASDKAEIDYLYAASGLSWSFTLV